MQKGEFEVINPRTEAAIHTDTASMLSVPLHAESPTFCSEGTSDSKREYFHALY